MSSSSSQHKQRLVAAILNFLANDKEADSDSLGVASQVISDSFNVNSSDASLQLPRQYTLLDVFEAGIKSLNIELEERLEDNPKYQQFIKQLEEMGYFRDCSEEQRLQRVEKAKEKFLARTQASKPDTVTAEQHKNEGNEFLKKKQYKEAINSYKNAIKSDPTNPIYPANMGAAYMQLNDYESAEKCCKKALELDPKYSKAHGRLGQIYQRLGNKSEAIKHFELGLELDSTNEEYKKKLDQLRNPSSSNAAAARSANPFGSGGANPFAGMGGMGGLSNLLGGLGGMGGGSGDGGADGLGGLGQMLNNPEFMRMAMDMMQKPEMQQMMQGMMQGMMGGGAGAQQSDDDDNTGGGDEQSSFANPFGGIDPAQLEQVLQEEEVQNSEKLTRIFQECRDNGTSALFQYMADPEVSSFMQRYAMKKLSSLPADQNPFSFMNNNRGGDNNDDDNNNDSIYS